MADTLTYKNNDTGKMVRFVWNAEAPPTEVDLEEIYQEAERTNQFYEEPSPGPVETAKAIGRKAIGLFRRPAAPQEEEPQQPSEALEVEPKPLSAMAGGLIGRMGIPEEPPETPRAPEPWSQGYKRLMRERETAKRLYEKAHRPPQGLQVTGEPTPPPPEVGRAVRVAEAVGGYPLAKEVRKALPPWLMTPDEQEEWEREEVLREATRIQDELDRKYGKLRGYATKEKVAGELDRLVEEVKPEGLRSTVKERVLEMQSTRGERILAPFAEAAAIVTEFFERKPDPRAYISPKRMKFGPEYTEQVRRGREVSEKLGINPKNVNFDQDNNPQFTTDQTALLRQVFEYAVGEGGEAAESQAAGMMDDFVAYLTEADFQRAKEEYERGGVAPHLARIEDVLDPKDERRTDLENDIRKIEESPNYGLVRNTINSAIEGRLGMAIDQLIFDAAMMMNEKEARKANDLRHRFSEVVSKRAGDRNAIANAYYDAIRMIVPMVETGLKGKVPVIGQLWSVSEWAKQGSGDMHGTMLDQGVDFETARSVSAMAGVPYALIERLQLGQIVSGISEASMKSAAFKGIKKAFMRLLSERGPEYLVQVSEEGWQAVMSEVAVEIAREASGLGARNMDDWQTALMELSRVFWDEAVGAGPGMGFLQALGLGRGAYQISREMYSNIKHGPAVRRAQAEGERAQRAEEQEEAEAERARQAPPPAEEAPPAGPPPAQEAPPAAEAPPAGEAPPAQEAPPAAEAPPEAPAVKPIISEEGVIDLEDISTLKDDLQRAREAKRKARDTSDPDQNALVAADQAHQRLENRFSGAMPPPQSKEEIWQRTARPVRILSERERYADDAYWEESVPMIKDLAAMSREGVYLDEDGVGIQTESAMNHAFDEAYQRRDEHGEFMAARGDLQNLRRLNSAIGHSGSNYIMYRLGQTMRKALAKVRGTEYRPGMGDELGLGGHMTEAQMRSTIDKIEKEHNSWVDTLTLQDVVDQAAKDGFSVSIAEGYSPETKLSELGHPKHDNMPTGAGKIHFGMAASKNHDNRHELLTAADQDLDTKIGGILGKLTEKLVDSEGNRLYTLGRDDQGNPVYRRTEHGRVKGEAAPGAGARGPDVRGAPEDIQQEQGPGGRGEGEAGPGGGRGARPEEAGVSAEDIAELEELRRFRDRVERARALAGEMDGEIELGEALAAIEEQDAAAAEGETISTEEALNRSREKATEFAFGAQEKPTAEAGPAPDGIRQDEWNAMSPGEREEIISGYESVEQERQEAELAERKRIANRQAEIAHAFRKIFNRIAGPRAYNRWLNYEIPASLPRELYQKLHDAVIEELRGVNKDSDFRREWIEARMPVSTDMQEEVTIQELHGMLRDISTKGQVEQGFFEEEEEVPLEATREERERREREEGEEKEPPPSPTDRNYKQPKQSKTETEIQETLQALDLTHIPGLDTPLQHAIQDGLQYSLGGYAEGRGRPVMLQLPEILELVRFLRSASPILKDRIRRKFTISGAFNPKTGQILLRRDIFRGPIIAEAEGSYRNMAIMRDRIIDELISQGIPQDEIDVVMRPIRGGKATRLTVYRLDPSYAGKVLAHEFGHLLNTIAEDPELMNSVRGNILGRIATLYKHIKHTLPAYPGAPGPVSAEEKRAIREAAQELVGKGVEKEVDEEIKTVLGVTPEIVTGILGRSMDDMRTSHPALYDYLAKLDRAEKKRVLVMALRDHVVADELKKFGEEIRVKTGKKTKVFVPATAEDRMRKYEELLRKEIERRQVVEKAVIMDELLRLTKIWRPYDSSKKTDYTKYRASPDELYADAISALLNDPELLMKEAPVFYKTFFYYASRKGPVAQQYLKIQRELEKKGILERRARGLRKMFAEDTENALARQLAEHAGIITQWREAWAALSQLTWDKNRDAIKKKRRAMKKGMHIPDTEDPQTQIQKFGHTTSMQTGYMHRMFALLRAAQEEGVDLEDLNEVAFEEREMFDRERKKIASAKGFTPVIAAEQREHLRRKVGPEKWKKLRKYLHAWRAMRFEAIVKPWAESGMLSKEQAIYVLNNPAYVTYNVVDEFLQKHGTASSLVTFRHQVGSLANIENVISATIAKDLSIIRAMNRAEAWSAWKRFTDKAIENGYLPEEDRHVKLDRNTDPVPPDMEKVLVEEDGKLNAYVATPGIALSFNEDPGLNVALTKFLNVAGWPNRVVKALYTGWNVGFALTNLKRDYDRTVFHAPGMLAPGSHYFMLLPRYLESIWPVFATVALNRPPEEIIRMYERGELYSVLSHRSMDNDSKALERQFARFKLGKDLTPKVLQPASRALDTILRFNEAVELIGKVAARKYLDKFYAGWPEMKKHVYVTTHLGSPDYSRTGRAAQLISIFAMFYNPQKEALRSDAEVFRERPVETTLKAIKSVVIPAMFEYFLLKGVAKHWFDPEDPEEKPAWEFFDFLHRFYQSVSIHDLHNYGTIPLGQNKDGTFSAFRIPLDESQRAMRGLIWAMLEAKEGDYDPAYFLDVINYMGDQLPSTAPLIELSGDIYHFATGKNVYDAWYNRWAIPEVYSKGSLRKTVAPIAFRYLFNKYGGRGFYKLPWGQETVPRKPLNQLLDVQIPIFDPVLDRFYKVYEPSSGERQRLYGSILRPIERTIHDERFERAKLLAGLLEESDYAPDLDMAAEAWEAVWGNWEKDMRKAVKAAELEGNEAKAESLKAKLDRGPPVTVEQYQNTWMRLTTLKFGTMWERLLLAFANQPDEVHEPILEHIYAIRLGEEQSKKKRGERYKTVRELRDEIDGMRMKISIYGNLIGRGEGER